MPRNQQDIVAQMRASLAISEPALDTQVGSTVRKILDVVGEVVAEASVDTYLLTYQYDIDAKSGTDLDDFVALFGFARLPANRATGTVIFERPVTATSGSIVLSLGTQVGTVDVPVIGFNLTTTAVIGPQASTVEVPVRAALGGPQGNVAANAIRRWITPVAGITAFANPLGTVGGTAEETDDQLRTRFKRTVFRGLTGTEQMFIGLALEDLDVTRVNVIGASKTQHEQIELVSGFGYSTARNVAYVYEDSSVFGVDLQGGNIFGEGVHYTFDPLGGPSITALNSTAVPDGVYQLEYDYLPRASRNNPQIGITNRVDVYVNGQREVQAQETLRWTSTKKFNTDPASPYYAPNYVRDDGSHPIVGNIFIPYSFTPVLNPSSDASIADGLVVNSVTYARDTDYFLVQDLSPKGGTPRSNSGIEWMVSNVVPEGTLFSATYIYNEIPTSIEASIARWRLVTTDVRVHQAEFVRLNLYFAVIFMEGYAVEATTSAMMTALAAFIQQSDFDQALQVSDLLQVAHDVSGVDAVRFLTSADDPVNYAIQRVADDGTTVLTTYASTIYLSDPTGRAIDVFFADSQIPVLNNVLCVAKAENTFMTDA